MAAGFRLQTKNILLTFSQCSYPLESFRDNVLALFEKEGIDKGAVSQERHADGNLHLHAIICLKKKLSTRKVDYFDNLVVPRHHPNIISKIKSLKASFLYVTKDGTFLPVPPDLDLQALLDSLKRKRSSRSLEVVTRIKEGATLDQLDEEMPEYLLLHLPRVQEYIKFQELKKLRIGFAKGQSVPICAAPAQGYDSSSNQRIASWLNSNIRQNRPHRTKQLWIDSPAGMGKTTLISMLEDTYDLKVYRWPADEKWWDAYSDGAYDLIVLDEFLGQKKIQELNPILSGDRVSLSRRNAPPYIKRDNLPVIILSNKSPRDIYHKVTPEYFETLNSRLEYVQVLYNEHIRLDFQLPCPPLPPPPPPEPDPVPVPAAPLVLAEEYVPFDDLPKFHPNPHFTPPYTPEFWTESEPDESTIADSDEEEDEDAYARYSSQVLSIFSDEADSE